MQKGAALVGPPRDGTNQPWMAIWTTDEFPAIFDDPDKKVSQVFIIDPITKIIEATPAWVRGQPAPAGWYNPITLPPPGSKLKRDEPAVAAPERESWKLDRDSDHARNVDIINGVDSDAVERRSTPTRDELLLPRQTEVAPPPGYFYGATVDSPEMRVFSK